MTGISRPDPVIRRPGLPPGAGAPARDLQLRVEGEVRFDAGSPGAYSTDASNYRQGGSGHLPSPLTEDAAKPPVLVSDTEPCPDLLPGHPLFRRRRSRAAVRVHARQELALSLRIAPGVCLEPPAPYRLRQGRQVALLTCLFERRIQLPVVSFQDLGAGVGGQYGPDRRRFASRAWQNLRWPGVRRSHL